MVVGGGVFGLSGALALRERGYGVTLVDSGPIPHPMAASNDISRMVRTDYGSDLLYQQLAAEAIRGWHGWNARWGRQLYHEVGLLLLSSQPFEQGGYEADSHRILTGEGWSLQRLSSSSIASRFPRWNPERYLDGYFNPRAGWAEAGTVVAAMAEAAMDAGISVKTGFQARSILRKGSRATGVVAGNGAEVRADEVVVAAGVWTPTLLPELDGFLRLSGQPIVYLRPSDPGDYRPPGFPTWGADLALTGWYGFPANGDGLVKIGSHGPGYRVSPDAPRVLPDTDDVTRCREFLSRSLPDLADAPLYDAKMCVYTDTWDGNFLISRHPEIQSLTVATGGSGHGFKFAPVLGGLTADAVEGIANPYLERFTWRPVGDQATEDARYTG